MRILHVCSDYPNTPVYQQLLKHFSARYQHSMYVPLPFKKKRIHCFDYSSTNVEVYYSFDFHKNERYFYHRKKHRIIDGINAFTNLADIDLLHGHFLFTAGGPAFEIHKLHRKPFVVSIRNSDKNAFFKKAVHLRNYGIQIMAAAEKVIFISPAYRDRLLSTYVPLALRETILKKSQVIPNGIDDYWLENRYFEKKVGIMSNKINLLFVGELTKNKNIPICVEVAKKMKKMGYEPVLRIVGSGTELHKLQQLAKKAPGLIEIIEGVYNKDELKDIYRNSDIFMMPSFAETFGLVYGEAISQGLPVIFSVGEGIDGYFPEGTIGYSCNPYDSNSILERIQLILQNYDSISQKCISSSAIFSWTRIANLYEELYDNVIE